MIIYGRKLKLSSKNAMLKAKIKMLECKNQMLEQKLENLELKAQLRAMKKQNKAIGEKLIEAEQKADMANNELKAISQQAIQQKMEEFDNKMVILNAEQQKQKQKTEEMQCLKHQLVTVTKRLLNPNRNRWNPFNTENTISSNGLNLGCINNYSSSSLLNVFAEKGFYISVEHCRKDHFTGTIVYYFEVTQMSSIDGLYSVGLSDGSLHENTEHVGQYPNSYGILNLLYISDLSEIRHEFALVNFEPKDIGLIIGCGILLNPENQWAIFFTAN